MSKYEKLLDMIYSKKDHAKQMKKVEDVIEELFDDLEKTNKPLYDKYCYELEEIAYEIDMTEAEQIVKAMKPYGQKWSYEQVKEYLKEKGITEKCIDYYIVMNYSYNDYYNTAKLVGKADDVDFYFSLSKDFITDVDGKPFKVAKYFGI